MCVANCKLAGNLAALESWQAWPCSRYAEGIGKRSFISTVRPTVHTNPSRNRWLCVFVRTKNIMKTEHCEKFSFIYLLWKRWHHDDHVVSLPVFYSTQIQNGHSLLRLQIRLRWRVEGKLLMRFQREIFKIEFLRRNMNTALVYNLFPSVSSLAIHEINEFQPFSLFNNVTQNQLLLLTLAMVLNWSKPC